ncbi:MAG: hypothetical protein AABP62_22420 [Planctomycetota bacterium]
MADAAPPRLSLRKCWHRLRTSPRFPFVLFFGLLIGSGLSQAYCYWWGVRIQRIVDRNDGRVERLDLLPAWVKQALGKHLPPLEPVRSVMLYPNASRKGKISGDDLRVLRGTLFLRELNLGGALTPEAREQLGYLTQLKSLHFNQSSAAAADAAVFARLPRLESLSLSYASSLSPEVYKRLAEMPRLKRLNLSPYNDGVAEEIRELSRSQSLRRLEGRFGSDKLLLAVTSLLPNGNRPLPNLRELCLSESSISDAGLANLRHLPSLVHLDLSQTLVTDEGLVHLKSSPFLRTLYLAGNTITDQGAATLASMHNLESLNLNMASLTEQGVMQLASLPRLRHLRISYVPPELLRKLRQRLPTDCKIDQH